MKKKIASLLALVMLVSVPVLTHANKNPNNVKDKLVRTEIEPNNINKKKVSENGKDVLVKTIVEPLDEVKFDESTSKIIRNPENISPLATQRVVDENLNNLYGSQSVKFDLTKGMPNYKVWIDNTSNTSYNVTITSRTSTGTVQDSFRVGAGNRATKIYSANLGSFDSKVRYVNVTSSDGSKLNGKVSVRIGTTVGELQ